MIFLDFEVLKFDWLLCWSDTNTQKFHYIYNNKDKLQGFYDYYKNEIMIGYNIQHYDKYILQGILCDFDPYDITKWIIQDDKQGWMYSRLFNNFPLITYDVMIKDKSLKFCEASLGLEIVESSIPFDINRKITAKEMMELIRYCQYDVQATMEVFLQDGFFLSPQDEYNSSLGIIKEFRFPIHYLSKTKSQLGCSVLSANKRRNTDDEFEIISPPNLILRKYEYIREWFLNPDNHWYKREIDGRKTEEKNELVTEVAGLKHTFAWGGVHASIQRQIVDGILLMCDFGSLYPNIMVQYDLISRGVPNPKRYKDLLETRLKLKALKDPREKSYKVALNGSYGQMKYLSSPLYDPKMANNVCIHGQLIALDLIEKIEPYGWIINSNTDGVLIKVDSEVNRKHVERICAEVAERVRIPIDIEEYKRFIVKDVNNYIAVTKSGKVKSKGAWVKDLSPLECTLKIVNTAIKEYFIHNIPVETTIGNSNNLMDFQIISKVGMKYEYSLHGDKILNEKTNRVFASKSLSNGGMFKLHKIAGIKEKVASTPEHCFIMNGDIREVKIPQKLDKNWYIDLANQRIKEFIGDNGK